MNRKIMIMILIVSLLLSLTACGHTHKWKAATCTAPKTCTGCGETQGEKTRHNVPEDGICTICKQKQDNVLTLKKKFRGFPPVVYGGVFLRMYMKSDRDDIGAMFPGQYTIYAEDGTEMASGDWGALRPDESNYDPNIRERAEDTEYIPLQPGKYQVKFTYYNKYDYDDIVTKTFVPVGEPNHVSYNFIVR